MICLYPGCTSDKLIHANGYCIAHQLITADDFAVYDTPVYDDNPPDVVSSDSYTGDFDGE